MMQRIITAVVASLILVLILCFGNVLIRPAVLTLALIGTWELTRSLKNKYNPMIIMSYIFTIINFIVLYIEERAEKTATVMLATIELVGITAMISMLILSVIKHQKYKLLDAALSIFAYIYTVGLFSFLYLLVTNNSQINPGNIFLLFILFGASWGSDMGGFFIGLLFGKHKLCEKLSPKKTIEGFFGGIGFSILFGVILTAIYKIIGYENYIVLDFMKMENISGILLSAALMSGLSVLAQLGDLVASSIKRHVSIKDYSNIMPGHGGILDRFDSVIFIVPVLYMIVKFICHV